MKKTNLSAVDSPKVVVPSLSLNSLTAVLDRALRIAESNPAAANALAAIVQASAANDIANRLDALAHWTAFVKDAPLEVLLDHPVRQPLELLLEEVLRLDGHATASNGKMA